jgi:hypothetical protein
MEIILDDPILSIFCCGLPLLALMIAIATIGTRSKIKFAKEIYENNKRGLYSTPKFVKQIRFYRTATLIIFSLILFGIIVLFGYYLDIPAGIHSVGGSTIVKLLVSIMIVLLISSIILSIYFNRIMKGNRTKQ